MVESKVMRGMIWNLLFLGFMFSAPAQDVSIPDAGLNAAVRDALHKPTGPLTESDLLTLTALDASLRNISNLSGLEAARNLATLSLQSNHLANLLVPAALTNLTTINLGSNPLTNCFVPDGLKKLSRILIQYGQLTNLALPTDMKELLELDLSVNHFTSFTIPTNLTAVGFLGLSQNQLTNFIIHTNLIELDNLDLSLNQFTAFEFPAHLTNISFLNLSFNLLTNCSLPNGLSRMASLNLKGNQFTAFTLPAGLTGGVDLDLSDNHLWTLAVPADMTNLLSLNLFFNQLTNLNLPPGLRSLSILNLNDNLLSALNLPPNLGSLSSLQLRSNQLTHFTLPEDLRALTYLDLGENKLVDVLLPVGLGQLSLLRISGNPLTSLRLPVGLTNLTGIFLRFNQLINLTLPPDLNRLQTLDALGNQLTSLTLPPGLTNLTALFLSGNQLKTLTIPPDMTQLISLVLDGNPFQILTLPEPLAIGSLAAVVANLRGESIPVFPYHQQISLVLPRPSSESGFEFTLLGPPGTYSTFGSENLSNWNLLGAATNQMGSAVFIDSASTLPKKFYRASLQSAPTNMIFVPATTFTMGSPSTEQDRSSDEGPQTIVTLTHSFWIGKYEVTQGEYLSIMGTNPSYFPGDLSRPISSVSWPAATNYCWKLTQRELAAGRIPPGAQFRLPTEAEWECAARAGTSSRFSYGDDPTYSGLTNHAWFYINGALTVHPVGLKRPNPAGLYDMEGNVWEWCQDWYGPLPGGNQIDPKGPPSNAIGFKVMRGGAYDYDVTDCRSARRLFFGNSEFLTDSDLGFRVVLETGPSQ